MESFRTKHGTFYLGDARELIRRVPSESVDIILTDPPYGLGTDEYDNPDVFFEMEDELYRVLKPNSFALFFYAIKHLPRAFELRRFRYMWMIPAIELSNTKYVHSRIGTNNYSIILIFAKGKPRPTTSSPDLVFTTDQLPIIDKNVVNELKKVRGGKQFKNTSVIATLLMRFTNRGDIVLDPFAGYGSIPLVCEVFRRRWVAFEIDPSKYAFAKNLLLKVIE